MAQPPPPPPSRGCRSPDAANFDSTAQVDDGSCVMRPPPPHSPPHPSSPPDSPPPSPPPSPPHSAPPPLPVFTGTHEACGDALGAYDVSRFKSLTSTSSRACLLRCATDPWCASFQLSRHSCILHQRAPHAAPHAWPADALPPTPSCWRRPRPPPPPASPPRSPLPLLAPHADFLGILGFSSGTALFILALAAMYILCHAPRYRRSAAREIAPAPTPLRALAWAREVETTPCSVSPALQQAERAVQPLILGLPTYAYDGRRGEGAECTLCLEPFRPTEMLRVLPCEHEFHRPCVDRWFATQKYRSRSCPLCKADPLHTTPDRANNARRSYAGDGQVLSQHLPQQRGVEPSRREVWVDPDEDRP